ncbi:unannotated protein [freshwater metagenome]|uniref:Unannotated protein n=1 Tax=freshwater metagenome TaxID=449393 RepID=A0A6J6EAH0_9ZZZZ|nr:hypothetical protein [Actinomycetota bacterium]
MKIFVEGVQTFFLNGLAATANNFGLEITNDKNSAELIIKVDPPKNTKIDNSRDVVILAEPEVVRPDLYSLKFLESTKYILPLGKYRANRLNLKYFINWPVELPKYKRAEKTKNQKIAIVNEHKFSSSARSKYGLRRAVVKHFETNFPGKLDLYGVEWKVNRQTEMKRRLFALRNHKSIASIDFTETFSDLWRTYKSCVSHMHQDCELLSEYTASICIENDNDYISEKVWKSLYAGCPVIYVGPDLVYDQNLKNCVIVANDNLDSIVRAFEKFDSGLFEEYSLKGLDFVHSINFEEYSLEAKTREFYSNLTSLLKI